MTNNSKKVLVIDDSIAICKFLEIKLKDHFLVDIATTSQQALQKVRENQFDVVISDLNIPTLEEGLELNHQIKREFPNLPLLAYTGTYEENTHNLCMKFGFSSVLEKSGDVSTILEAIHSNLGKTPPQNVLFVDDEDGILFAIESYIKETKNPNNFHFANSVEDALSICKRFPIHVVVTDLRMPETNGEGFIEQLASFELVKKIYVMSAFITPESKETLKKHQVVDFIPKPFEMKQIFELISS